MDEKREELVQRLNNQLAIILGTCDLLSRRAEDDPLALVRLQRIRDAAKEMADEINKPLSRGEGV
ncbi:MAG TPA: hypothetical protein VJX30_07660 [Terriglobales bacterium]|jgi:hypothetical protein|nr:hypothetical protein [Terriglobales bacterium]